MGPTSMRRWNKCRRSLTRIKAKVLTTQFSTSLQPVSWTYPLKLRTQVKMAVISI